MKSFNDLTMMIKIYGKIEAVYHYMDTQFTRISVFNKIKRIIDNYNKNLSNFYGDGTMLALYILNEEDKNATKNNTMSIMTAETSRLLARNYPTTWGKFKDKKEVSGYGSIELDESSKNLHISWIGKFDAGICVDFDVNQITTQHVFKSRSVMEYCVDSNILLCNFHMSDLPVIDINLDCFNFNEIEDVVDFLTLNEAWRMEDDDSNIYSYNK